MQIASFTGQSERTVADWIREFRAEHLVRVADVTRTGAEIYQWIEEDGPQWDSRKVRVSFEKRSAAWRKRKSNETGLG